MDRISELPPPILHQILSFLYITKAVQTSALSKSWRYLWSTRPKFNMYETDFGDQQFMHVLDKTLQGYHDQNLSIHEFWVGLSTFDAASILEKWIPILIHDMHVKEFDLRYDIWYAADTGYFDLPPVVFESQHLRKLCLHRCDLNTRLDSIDTRLHLKSLRRLDLEQDRVSDDNFDKIISSCPLLEYLYLEKCKELRNIKMINTAHNLKSFHFQPSKEGNGNSRIEIDGPNIEKMWIMSCRYWSHYQNYFRRLIYLYLQNVRLSAKSFDCFSTNFPSIENLRIIDCYGFKRIQISSASIKFLSLQYMSEEVKMVAIDAPNIVDFLYEGPLPWSFSFKTTSSEWSSKISLGIEKHRAWLLRLNEVLKALSRSKISLYISCEDPPGIGGCRLYKPVVLEKLMLPNFGQSSILMGFINGLFRISRPREILGCKYCGKELHGWCLRDNQLTEILCTLLLEGETIDGKMSEWKQHLEEASTDYRGVNWHRVDAPSWLEPRAALLQNKLANHLFLRFRLKWREN